MIPILELKTQYREIRAEVEEAVRRVLESTHYILGPEVQAFEEEFARFHGVPCCIGVGSGTEALHLTLRALGIGPGDEVICPAFTFAATAGAIGLAGATPVFADVDPESYGLDPRSVEACITPRTRAVIPVHLYGHPAPMGPLLDLARRHGLAVVEDCAQATGAEWRGRKVGTLGDAGCFSFFPSKNLGGIGDGGAVLTARPELADRIRMLRAHGGHVKYRHQVLGTNSRLDEIQAAVLRVKLRHLPRWNRLRREIAADYTARLSGLELVLPVERPGCLHVYHQYTLRSPCRDALLDHLRTHGVGAVVYYPVSLHQQEAFARLARVPAPLPVTERLQGEVLSLPMYPELTPQQREGIAGQVRSFTQNRAAC